MISKFKKFKFQKNMLLCASRLFTAGIAFKIVKYIIDDFIKYSPF